jgi:hypothetical protein
VNPCAVMEVLCFPEKKSRTILFRNCSRSLPFRSPPTRSSSRAREKGWIFISAAYKGKGKLNILLDNASGGEPVVLYAAASAAERSSLAEAVRRVAKGEHKIRVDCEGNLSVDKLVVKSIPELVQCGLNSSSIKSYGPFDMGFLKKDVLPNVTTLIVSPGIKLPPSVIDDWHRQGKKFIGEVGLNREGRTGDVNFEFYTKFLDAAPFLDGLIINEFGMNRIARPPIQCVKSGQRNGTVL